MADNVITTDISNKLVDVAGLEHFWSKTKEYVNVGISGLENGKVKDNSDAIEVLTGVGTGSVDYKINQAFNEFATNVSNDEVVNTYKELIDYAAAHGPEFTELVGEFDSHTEDTTIHVTADEKKYWNDSIKLAKEDSYVTAAALIDLNDRLELHKNEVVALFEENASADQTYAKQYVDEKFASVQIASDEDIDNLFK
jgi:hypothetical protein